MSEATTRAALKAAIDAQFSSPKVLTFKESESASKDHIVLFLSRRYVDGRMVGGDLRVKGGRAITRFLARDEDNIAELRERTAAAVEEKFLTGADGPLVFEAATDVEEDGGWFIASDSWTY